MAQERKNLWQFLLASSELQSAGLFAKPPQNGFREVTSRVRFNGKSRNRMAGKQGGQGNLGYPSSGQFDRSF